MDYPANEPASASPGDASPEFEYWAFIGYSRQDNSPARSSGESGCMPWADWLHRELETYRVPDDLRRRGASASGRLPERLQPCYRDDEESPANGKLSEEAYRALDHSVFLIVIASPRSAKSAYVNEQVRYFRALGRGDRILSMIVDGEPNVRLRPKEGWSADHECFCPAMVHPLAEDGSVDQTLLLAEEPIAADVRVKDVEAPREMKAKESRRALQRQVLDHMKLKLISSLLGVGLDDLAQRDHSRMLREARLRSVRFQRLALLFGAFALVACGLAFAALRQHGVTSAVTHEENEAHRQHLETLIESIRSDRLIAQSKFGTPDESAAFAYLARAVQQESAAKSEQAASHVILPAKDAPDGAGAARAALGALLRWRHIYPSLIVKLFCADAQFTPDGAGICTSAKQMVDAASGQVLYGESPRFLNDTESVQMSADGTRLLTTGGGGHGLAHIWDAKTGRLLVNIQPETKAYDLYQETHGPPRITRPGPYPMGQGTVPEGMIRNPNVSQLALNPNRHTADLTGAQFSPDGTKVLTTSLDGTARIWQAADGKLIMNLGGKVPKVFGPSGLGTGSMPFNHNPDFKGAFESGPVRSAHFSPDAHLVVTLHTSPKSNDIWDPDSGALWNAENGHLLAVLDCIGKDPVHGNASGADSASGGNGKGMTTAAIAGRLDFQFSADGKLILGVRGVNVYIWSASPQVDDPRYNIGFRPGYLPVALLKGNLDSITSARFSPDGRFVLSASNDKTARIWSIGESARLISSAIERDKKEKAGAVNGNPAARIFNYGPQIDIAPRTMRHEDAVNSAEFSPDGKRIVTTSDDKTARLWIGSSERIILDGHQDKVSGGKFSPDGAKIVTTCRDGFLRIWKPGFYETAIPSGNSGNAGGLSNALDGIALPPPPDWFPDFLTYLGQRRFDANGTLETVKPEEWLALREKLRAVIHHSAGKDDPYLTALRHWVEAS